MTCISRFGVLEYRNNFYFNQSISPLTEIIFQPINFSILYSLLNLCHFHKLQKKYAFEKKLLQTPFFGMFSHFHSFHLNLDPLHLHPPGPGGLVQDVLHEVANHLPLRQDLRQGLKRDSDYFHVHEPILGNIDWT